MSFRLHEALLQVGEVALSGLQTYHIGENGDIYYPYLPSGLPEHLWAKVNIFNDRIRRVIEEAMIPKKAVGDWVICHGVLNLSRVRWPGIHYWCQTKVGQPAEHWDLGVVLGVHVVLGEYESVHLPGMLGEVEFYFFKVGFMLPAITVDCGEENIFRINSLLFENSVHFSEAVVLIGMLSWCFPFY